MFITCSLNVFSDEVVRDVIEESEIDHSLLENIVVYGIISELRNQNTNVSATCANDLTSILRSINKQDMWAVKGTSQFARNYYFYFSNFRYIIVLEDILCEIYKNMF